MTADEEHWLTQQGRISARRLADTDPFLLSPTGRDLHDFAIDLLGDRRRKHLRLIQNPDTEE